MGPATSFFRPAKAGSRRLIGVVVAAVLASFSLSATTLQRLSMAEMIGESTAIVRARVIGSVGAYHGTNIYTHYRLQVLETLKSSGQTGRAVDVAVPGGAASGMRQAVAGAPVLKPGEEYVLFLWRGSSGVNQLIGLSQGILDVGTDPSGAVVLTRPAIGELMLDSSGLPVEDQAVQIGLEALRTQISQQARGAR